jgi:hypothetical protein
VIWSETRRSTATDDELVEFESIADLMPAGAINPAHPAPLAKW